MRVIVWFYRYAGVGLCSMDRIVGTHSKKRGLSLEQKRKKMLPIFYESQDFYLLKELEKMGPRKGVISQSVKDFVQSLVDDDLVSKDRNFCILLEST
ncbi:Meiotic nuclear division protein 1-like [Glycine soja]|uniref:Meiotic nuclear division protein 1-like n=1 Tax=Glycine soja TaxID=3848 RepID=A0A445JW12_GLYSO|nr:Meiotic nuclear division protein 1-like [Glycine soja]